MQAKKGLPGAWHVFLPKTPPARQWVRVPGKEKPRRKDGVVKLLQASCKISVLVAPRVWA